MSEFQDNFLLAVKNRGNAGLDVQQPIINPQRGGFMMTSVIRSLIKTAGIHMTACCPNLPYIRALESSNMGSHVVYQIVATAARGYQQHASADTKKRYMALELFLTNHKNDWLVPAHLAAEELVKRFVMGCYPWPQKFDPLTAPIPEGTEPVSDLERIALAMQVHANITTDLSTLTANRDDLGLAFVISACTQGSVTISKMKKINTGLEEDLKRMPDISAELVHVLWSDIKQTMDESRIADFISEWSKSIDQDQIMRLFILLEQAEWGGMTTYKLIERAVNGFHEFEWDLIFNLVFNEYLAYKRAHKLVQNRPYYAYNKNFSAIHSSQFKSIGYAAWSVLTKSGVMSLTNYRGFDSGQITAKPQIDIIVNNWASRQRATSDSLNPIFKKDVSAFLSFHRTDEEQDTDGSDDSDDNEGDDGPDDLQPATTISQTYVAPATIPSSMDMDAAMPGPSGIPRVQPQTMIEPQIESSARSLRASRAKKTPAPKTGRSKKKKPEKTGKSTRDRSRSQHVEDKASDADD